MDTEALQTPDHVFLATHNPMTMYLQSLTDVNVKQEYNEQQFLQDFLKPEDFAFVAVLGGAGTGKSHLIRWLAAKIQQLPTQKTRKVLLIPRSGTNLRDIIERIVNLMEGARADEYRTRLADATNSLGEDEARGQLLNNLATLIEYSGATDLTRSDEAEVYVAANLPALLLDWHFRQHLLRDGAIIHRLITHIMGAVDSIEAVEERRRFTVEDLPLNVLDIQHAGARAREFYAFLISDPETQRTTIETLNHYLDAAIARMLQLNREDLERLMREVRETLAEDDVELVLLIEDFAKLQGIDRQVLAAVIERPEEPDRPRQCALRTALACTVGYFDSLRDTVKQRTTFSVSLDVEVGDAKLIKKEDVLSFITRYLNAARLPEQSLIDWYKQVVDGEDDAEKFVPSQCKDCSHEDACHAGFGQVNRFGLYPFTSKAVDRMLERVSGGRFNPRLIIKDILKHSLENYADSLAEGQFPPPALVQHFGGARIGANLRMQIRSADPLNYDRREVLIDLWTEGTKLTNVDERIHGAFDLPLLKNVGQIPTAESTQTIQEAPQIAVLPGPLEERLRLLDAWANGAQLPQEVAQALRPLVYASVCERIPWDAELLLRGKFVSATGGIFSRRFVNFHNAATYTNPVHGVELMIGKGGQYLTEESVALQALLKHNHYGNWNYAGGTVDFRAYAKRLEEWGRIVVEQIRMRPRVSGEKWSPVPALAELLALGVRMAGRPAGVEYNLSDLIDALFTPYEPTGAASRSDAWKNLFEVFCQHRVELTEMLTAYIPCTKGGFPRLQVIDAVQLIEPLRNLRKTWHPQSEIPTDLRGDLRVIQQVHEKVGHLFDKAIEEEKKRHLEWRDQVVAMLGDIENRSHVIDLLRIAIERARTAGEFSGGAASAEELLETIKQFERAHLDRCVAAVHRVEQEQDSGRVFEELSRVPQDTMGKTEDFLIKAKTFLGNSTTRVDTRIENLRQTGGEELESSQEAIRERLAQLEQLATEIRTI
jgi:hypothetical protein